MRVNVNFQFCQIWRNCLLPKKSIIPSVIVIKTFCFGIYLELWSNGFRMFITHLPILSIELVLVALFSWIESETEFIKDMKRLRKILNGFQV